MAWPPATKSAQRGGEIAVDDLDEPPAAREPSAGVVDKKAHHGAKVFVAAPRQQLLVGDVKALHGIGRDVAAATLSIFDDVLVEVRQLERGADVV